MTKKKSEKNRNEPDSADWDRCVPCLQRGVEWWEIDGDILFPVHGGTVNETVGNVTGGTGIIECIRLMRVHQRSQSEHSGYHSHLNHMRPN
mmetsp:Transcript_27631/g.64878  ORF Transcript_27631/g.64878 Transcript_27631/m.64878 type:complete len:91 (+) Transcript_27631:995-1267(+)